MAKATVTIPLDAEAARLYAEASPEVQRKLSLLLSLWLRGFAPETRSLRQIMDDMGRQAAERGLTPEILETLLSDE